jgi:hypothetical protein
MRKLVYLGIESTHFKSKTRFGKGNKFYFEVENTKSLFENILVVYGGPGVDRR